MENIGTLNIANLLTAGAILDAIPSAVFESADDPLTAQAVLFALLLDPDEEIRSRQFNLISRRGSEFLMNETQRLEPQISTKSLKCSS